jgi:glycosyltransferase involved in cell wall biosynthesis
MNGNTRKISVVMAVYNGEPHMREAIESIVSQTFSDFEYILLDDGSSDGTLEILQEYEKRDKRIRVLQNQGNIGLTKSLNKGILASRGEYVARMDADDISHPKRFELQTAFLDSNQNCGVVGSWYVKIDEQGKELWRKKLPLKDEEIKNLLIKSNVFPHASAMVRRAALDKVGLYNESWKLSQDYELWFRIGSQYEIGVIPEFLIYSRISGSSLTNARNREQILYGLRAQRSAIRRGQYPKSAYIFFFRRLLYLLVPITLRQLLKRLV